MAKDLALGVCPTGPYIMYAYARIRSIQRQVSVDESIEGKIRFCRLFGTELHPSALHLARASFWRSDLWKVTEVCCNVSVHETLT